MPLYIWQGNRYRVGQLLPRQRPGMTWCGVATISPSCDHVRRTVLLIQQQQRFHGPYTWDDPGKPASELSKTLTQYTTLKFLTALPTFPPRPPSLPLGSNTEEKPGK